MDKHVIDRRFARRLAPVALIASASNRQSLDRVAISVVDHHGFRDTPRILAIDLLQYLADRRQREFARHMPLALIRGRDSCIFQDKETACQESRESRIPGETASNNHATMVG